MTDAAPMTFYEEVGGHDVFVPLIHDFYQRVAQDALLRTMYPLHDMDGAEWRLRTFLEQFWGGPTDYSQRRGHPRLRARHVAFHVNPEARDHWLGHMRDALDEQNLPPLHADVIWDYLQRSAYAMVNTFEPTPPYPPSPAAPTDAAERTV
ncbi:globin [Microbacterium kribbense]|uniref:Globin n=1 Tax=Microbacterium kribbense TaxID=433645 RepID=A0ABP7GP31_9MICO